MVATDITVLMGVSQPMVRLHLFNVQFINALIFVGQSAK